MTTASRSSRLSGRGAPLAVVGLGVIASVVTLLYVAGAPVGLVRFNDFYRESWPAYSALIHGHLVGFLQLGPAYAGSLVLRAPFAAIPAAWGGGAREIYFASALPCMIAASVFACWLAAQPRRRGGIGWASRTTPIVFCVLNPVVLVALFGGHPEEVLGAVLCVGAVILAVKGRGGWAGLLVGLAVVNKPWGLVAVPVVMVALPSGRFRAALSAGATAAVVVVPIAIAAPAHGVSAAVGSGRIGTIFNPSQLLWWFGPGSWIAQNARAAIVLCAIACAGLWAFARRDGPRSADRMPDALLLLTLVFLLRAALDPWDNLYYHVPFLFALIAFEVRSGRIPLLTILYTIVLNVVATINGFPHMTPDLRAAAYAATILPTIGVLVATLFAGRITERLPLISRLVPSYR